MHVVLDLAIVTPADMISHPLRQFSLLSHRLRLVGVSRVGPFLAWPSILQPTTLVTPLSDRRDEGHERMRCLYSNPKSTVVSC